MLDNSELDTAEIQRLIGDEDWCEDFASDHPSLHGFALADRLAEQVSN